MFFTYDQNNSGGSFVINKNVTQYVIVEADSADDANDRAEQVGVYFDGVQNEMDCECCGDRWYRAWSDGDGLPMIYGNSPENHRSMFVNKGEVYARVFYKNGRIVEYKA